MTAATALDVRPLTDAVGAEIHGVDLSVEPDPPTVAGIHAALARHGVVFFRDQRLTPEAQCALAERFGSINVNRFFQPVAGHPRVAEVRKEPDQRRNIGANWHTDHSYDAAPAMGSILYALEVPACGGDTLFAGMHAAWAALSDGLQRLLSTQRAVHSSRHVFGASRYADDADREELAGRLGNPDHAQQDAVHPVVIRHPASGLPCLYVNPQFTIGIDGWTPEESCALLEFLYAHASRPEFTCRFAWRAGSVAFWDNRATWHSAMNDYHGHRRLMHRVTIEGTTLEVFVPARAA